MQEDSKKHITPTDANHLLPVVLLDEIIKYIEKTEETIEGEWGLGRDLKELIRDKEMPELYDKLIELRNVR